ncbi:MAG: universal stress protein, partial [Bacteroidota bacterium]
EKERLSNFIESINVDWFSDIMKTAIVEPKFVVGFPADEIIKLTKKSDTAMVVMGTSGSGGAMSRLVGSVSTKVARKSSCPVLLVPPHARYKKIKKVICYIDDVETVPINDSLLLKLVSELNAELIVASNFQYASEKWINQLRSIYPAMKLSCRHIQNTDMLCLLTKVCKEQDGDIIAVSSISQRSLAHVLQDDTISRMTDGLRIPLLVNDTRRTGR